MNVTIVCEGYRNSTISLQPWRRIHEISTRIKTNSVNVTVISDKESTESATEQIEGVVVKRIPHLMWTPIGNRKMLIRAILEDKPDLVVWYGSPLSAIYLTRLKSLGVPLIWDIDRDVTSLRSLRKLSFKEVFNPHHFFLWQQLMTALLPRRIVRIVANSIFISKIVVPSQSLKAVLHKIGVDPGRIEVIPSTIERDALSSFWINEQPVECKKQIGFKASDFIVTYFGSPCTLRGVDTVILCLPRILKQRKNVRLIVLSRRNIAATLATETDGYLEAEEEAINQLIRKIGVEKYVEMISGVLDRKKLGRYLLASDVVALPFKIVSSEPPLSIFEAMNLGKVVITSNVGSLPEIVGADRGIVIDLGDAKALSQAILFLADHPDAAAQLGESAQHYAESLPSWNHVALRFAKLFEEAKNLSCWSK